VSALALTIKATCSSDDLARIVAFAAAHGATEWTIGVYSLTTTLDPAQLDDGSSAAELVRGVIRKPAPKPAAPIVDIPRGPRGTPEPDVEDQDDESPTDDTPKHKPFRTGSTRHRILTLLESQGGRWDGGAAALARKVSPDAPASAASEITKMIKADLLVRHGEGKRVTALTLPGVDDQPAPPPIEPRFERGPVDVDAARERAAGAL